MCGIAAIFGRMQEANIKAMNALIRHRGPDDEGYVLFESNSRAPRVFGGIDTPDDTYFSSFPYTPHRTAQEEHISLVGAMGHRRLSIVDLSPAGHQPMCTDDQRYWIVYNGEVYNHSELRKDLEALGHRFLSHSDTEVILKAYQEWGQTCLQRFNGMFAFVIYDQKEKRIFAARDRFGVKPLYYWQSPEGFIAFASEIKQFTVLPGWQARMNGQCVYDYLVWAITDHTSDTLFEGVKQLRGGECLECLMRDGSSIQPIIHEWYRLKGSPFSGSFQDAAVGFRELLDDAVKLRLRADVDVGSCLSGGLDSSSIVCLANQNLRSQGAQGRQKTFSACSEEKRFDERSYIDRVVQDCGVDAQYCYPSLESLLKQIREITWHQDEPFGSTSIFAQWTVFKLAKDSQVKVMLDGQGADEHLAGYFHYFGHRLYDLARSFRWGRLVREMQALKRVHRIESPIKLLLNQVLPESIRQPIRRALGKPSIGSSWFDVGRLGAVDRDPFRDQPRRSMQDQSRLQLTQSNLPMLLHWEDRDSMAHSVESRTPFLDYRLVEFVFGLPSHHKLSDGVTKRVLREGMKGVLPEEIRGRMDKLGFATAEEVWMKKDNPELFRGLVRKAIEKSEGIIKPEAMKHVEAILAGKKPFSFFIWRLISFGEWVEAFSVKVKS